jgi:predicted SnoaL-like aldol condensation-catalyzing enzyme
VVLIWEREAKDPADPSKMYKYNDFDLFRVENGKLAEHWDGAVKNAPGGRGKE